MTSERAPGMLRTTTAFDLHPHLPPGWVEHSNPEGPREFRARADGSTGLLQVSVFPDHQFEFVAKQTDLGAIAATIGKGLGARGQNWGAPAGSKHGPCAMGRLGFAMFQGGEYPAMFLWVTVSTRAAWLWTWLGPNPVADEVKQALEIVLGAEERASTP